MQLPVTVYKKIIKSTAFVAVFLLLPVISGAQSTADVDSVHKIKRRYRNTVIGLGAGYAAGMTVLYQQWYKDYPQSSFHLFNDGDEWLQMDKAGHAGSAYYLARLNTAIVRTTGVSERKAVLTGLAASYGFMLTIEVFDGFSSAWGFSFPDIAANTGGVLLYSAQQYGWGEQRITYKYSIHQSGLAQYRPNLLGSTIPERILKDYNGQTYWLSANLSSFHIGGNKFPKWLNFAVGYGADGMLGAFENPTEYNGTALPQKERVRQFYLSADVDLSKIHTRSNFLNGFFNVFGFVKIPAPALEFRSNGVTYFHPLYF